ncbi:MAG TPA: hypothetical protein VGI40_00855 [Pirellulaceae bacterium]
MNLYFLIILSAVAAAPNDPGAVTAGDVLNCDFEVRTDRDYDGWPDGWTRKHSRELPEFLRVGIVEESGARGQETGDGKQGTGAGSKSLNHCLEIELNGGAAVVSSPPQPVSTQFSLAMSVRIKTVGLVHDGAWVELTLVDDEGREVQKHVTQPVTKCPEWQTIALPPIDAVSEKVAKAVVSLHLAPLGKHEDLRGRAWFDDLRIMRLPRMQLTSVGSMGIYGKKDSAELACSVSGIRARNPRVRFELFEHDGKLLSEASTALLSAADAAKWAAKELPADGYAGQTTWTPPFPDFGFYHVRASLLGEESDQVLLDRTQTIAYLRPLTTPPKSEFGWTLPGGEELIDYGKLANLLGQSGLGWAKMPVWHDPKETAATDRIAWFAEQLSIQGIELVGILDQPPPELRAVFREQGRLPVATVFEEPELWQPAVAPTMTRLSLKVHWWQLGNDEDISFVGHPNLEAKVAQIKKHLEQYGQQIHLGINWRWIYSPPKAVGPRGAPWSCLCYSIDPPLTAEETALYVPAVVADAPSQPAEKRMKTTSVSVGRGSAAVARAAAANRSIAPPTRRWMQISPLARDEYSSDVRLQDLVQRMLAAKMTGVQAIFMPQPFSSDAGIMNEDGTPGELFVPWRTTAMLLGGAEYLGSMQLPGGTTGHMFARNGNAVMAVWSDRPTIEGVDLAENIEQIDVWGRGTKPKTREEDGRKLSELSIGPLPTFVTGLSEGVAKWQSALTFENSQLSSIAGREQTLMLRMKNTFPQGVSGELTLFAPKSWGVDPRPTRFKIAAGEELRLPLTVMLMTDANSGPQPVRLDFDVAGHHFSVHRTLQLGLDDVQVERTAGLKNGALIVEVHLANLSDRPLSFQCVLFAPDRRRQTRQVINLGRDRITLKFVLPDGDELIGKKLWLRAEEIGGSRVLNYTIDAER